MAARRDQDAKTLATKKSAPADTAVKRMIKLARKRGFVTYAELNAVLPSEEVKPEQIEDILAMLSEIGINVIENEEHDDASPEESAEEAEAEGGDLIEAEQVVKTAAPRSAQEIEERWAGDYDPFRWEFKQDAGDFLFGHLVTAGGSHLHMTETINKIVRTSRQMLHEIGREPTPEELAEKLAMPLEKVRKVLKIAKEPVSLETPIGDEEDSHLGDFIEDKNAILPIDAANQSISAEPQSDAHVLCVKIFDFAVDRLGHIAEELDGLALSMTAAIAEIEAEGDRIDRLQADNRAMLDDLLNGS